MTTTEAPKKIKIPMSERRPLNISETDWPLIASAEEHDGQVECEANHKWAIRVREHADGRRLVYGWLRSGPGGVHAGWRGSEGGFLVPPLGHVPDDDGTIRAIRRMGGIVDDDKLADECIADMPAESLDEDAQPAMQGASTDKLALLLALLVQARPHCPADLQAEIVAAIKAG
jgi:hypothetical protein